MDFQQFLYSALNAILLAVIPILVAFIAQKLHVQTKNEKLNQYLCLVEDAIRSAVDYVGQTIVYEIKKDGAFDKAEQVKAFEAAKAMAMQIIGETGINCEVYFECIRSRDCFTTKTEKRAIENQIAAYHAKYNSVRGIKSDD